MKKITYILLLSATAGLFAFGGFIYGRAYQERWRLVELPKSIYQGREPESTNPKFKQAYQELLTLPSIEGIAVGPGGTRGGFHCLFEPIYEYGNVSDFKTMALYTNPIVRAMGLLCLKYRTPCDAAQIGFSCQYDDEKVLYFPGGCSGSAYPYRILAIMEILGREDFIDTRDLARKIDERRP